MTKEQLAEIKARCEAATQGKWFYNNGSISTFVDGLVDGHPVMRDIVDMPSETDEEDCLADLEFIAHAREDIPALLAELDQMIALMRPIATIFERLKTKQTNADKVRAMTDEELATFLSDNSTGCAYDKGDYDPAIMKWLQAAQS